MAVVHRAGQTAFGMPAKNVNQQMGDLGSRFGAANDSQRRHRLAMFGYPSYASSLHPSSPRNNPGLEGLPIDVQVSHHVYVLG